MNTHKIILEGFDHIQTAMLYAKLGDIEIPNSVINISLTQSINYGKYDHIWYGGTMVIVQYKDNEFELVANGDIRANLYSKPDNTELAMVKDKSNYSLFYDEMASKVDVFSVCCISRDIGVDSDFSFLGYDFLGSDFPFPLHLVLK